MREQEFSRSHKRLLNGESCNVWGRYYLQVLGQFDPCIVVF
jgi:hypothetical protein